MVRGMIKVVAKNSYENQKHTNEKKKAAHNPSRIISWLFLDTIGNQQRTTTAETQPCSHSDSYMTRRSGSSNLDKTKYSQNDTE